jgi:hypothetical protein
MSNKKTKSKNEDSILDDNDLFVEDSTSNKEVVLVDNKEDYIFGHIVYVYNDIEKRKHAKNIVLYPGINEVRYANWQEFEQNPMVQTKIDEGSLIVHGQNSFSRLDEKEKIRKAKRIFDIRFLKKLERTEKNNVLAAIRKQLEKINAKHLHN